ncbi:unnamed protein product, partial [Eruca vesicaria subsp. sativa]|nr:unnamed protein product [Eruca vesicaria subsp. sativa]
MSKTVHFSSGNPRIGETRGVMHLFPDDSVSPSSSSSSSNLPVRSLPYVIQIGYSFDWLHEFISAFFSCLCSLREWGAKFTPWVVEAAKAYPWFENVCLKRMFVTDDDLALLAESFPGFKELVLLCCEGFGTSDIVLVANKCRKLRVLDLIESQVADDEMDWISCF